MDPTLIALLGGGISLLFGVLQWSVQRNIAALDKTVEVQALALKAALQEQNARHTVSEERVRKLETETLQVLRTELRADLDSKLGPITATLHEMAKTLEVLKDRAHTGRTDDTGMFPSSGPMKEPGARRRRAP